MSDQFLQIAEIRLAIHRMPPVYKIIGDHGLWPVRQQHRTHTNDFKIPERRRSTSATQRHGDLRGRYLPVVGFRGPLLPLSGLRGWSILQDLRSQPLKRTSLELVLAVVRARIDAACKPDPIHPGQNLHHLHTAWVGSPSPVRNVDFLPHRTEIGQRLHHNGQGQRNGPLKQRAIATKRPRPRPEVPHPIPQSPDIVTLEVHLQRVSLYHVVTEVRTVLPVHEDHRRERDPPVEPRAFFQTSLPEGREADQIKKPITQEIEDLLAAVAPTGALG